MATVTGFSDNDLIVKMLFEYALATHMEYPWYGFYNRVLLPLERVSMLEISTVAEDEYLSCTAIFPQHWFPSGIGIKDIRHANEYHDEVKSDDQLDLLGAPEPESVYLIEKVTCKAHAGQDASSSNSTEPDEQPQSNDSEQANYIRTVDGSRVPDFARCRFYLKNAENPRPIALRYDLLVENKGYGWFKNNIKGPNDTVERVLSSHVYRQLLAQAARAFDEDQKLPVISAIAAIGERWMYFEPIRTEALSEESMTMAQHDFVVPEEGTFRTGVLYEFRKHNSAEQTELITQLIERLDELDESIFPMYLS